HLFLTDFGVGIIEGREAQAVAKRIERLLAEILIGAAVHAVAAERGQLSDRFVESDGQAAGGIVVAGKNIGDCVSAFFSGIPGFENSGSMFLSSIDGDRAAAG